MNIELLQPLLQGFIPFQTLLQREATLSCRPDSAHRPLRNGSSCLAPAAARAID